MEIILLIMGGLVQGVTISALTGYARELRDGGSTSRFFPWIVQCISLSLVTAPLYVLFPQAALALDIAYYSSVALISVLNYTYSIFHRNQLAQNSGEELRLRLPYDLQRNELIQRIVLALTPNIHLGLAAIYIVSLGLTVMLTGAYLSVSCILGAVLLDQFYQWNWFPSFLQQPYQLLRLALFSSWVFGLDSLITIGLTTVNVAVFIWNYVTIHLWGTRSPTYQFKIAEAEHEFSFEKNLAGVKPQTSQQIRQLLDNLQTSLDVRITYNHFRESALATNKLLANAPVLDNAGYLTLFNRLDFNKPALRELIVNHMAVHDKFHERSLEERRVELELPEGSERVDIYIAFLKKEMGHLVERLNNPSGSRSITHLQSLTLTGQSRRVLEHLQQHRDDVVLQEHTLIKLALSTGSHCSRIYLETFAAVSNSLHFETADLTLKERAALMAQTVRDEEYKRYYYNIMREFYPYIDPNDYHSYENFVATYAGFFYLQNESLQNRFPDGADLLLDRFAYFVLARIGGEPAFSRCYNEKTLVKSVICGQLHPLFQQWCEEFYPGAYTEWVLDEYSLVNDSSIDVEALAILMLLDLGMAELTHPLATEVLERLNPSSYSGPLRAVTQNRNRPASALARRMEVDAGFGITNPAEQEADLDDSREQTRFGMR